MSTLPTNAHSSTTTSSKPNGADYEPDDEWKAQLRKRIEEGLQPMVADAREKLAAESRKTPDTPEIRIRLEADYKQAVQTIKNLAIAEYQLELDRERNQRRWIIKRRSHQTDNSVRTASESPTEERRSTVVKEASVLAPSSVLPAPRNPSVFSYRRFTQPPPSYHNSGPHDNRPGFGGRETKLHYNGGTAADVSDSDEDEETDENDDDTSQDVIKARRLRDLEAKKQKLKECRREADDELERTELEIQQLAGQETRKMMKDGEERRDEAGWKEDARRREEEFGKKVVEIRRIEEEVKKKEAEMKRKEREAEIREQDARQQEEAAKRKENELIRKAQELNRKEEEVKQRAVQLEHDTERMKQRQLEAQKFVEYIKKTKEEILKKDVEMKEREDILRRREAELIRREAMQEARQREEARKDADARRREEEVGKKELEIRRMVEVVEKMEAEAKRMERETKMKEQDAREKEETAQRKEDEVIRKTEELNRKEEQAKQRAVQLEQETERMKQMQLAVQKFVEDLQKMKEEALKKDLKMKDREDILRQREAVLIHREADNFRRAEEARRKEEEAKQKEVAARQEEARKREELKKEEARQEQARIEKARHEEEIRKEEIRQEEARKEEVRKEEARKREEALQKAAERQEAERKAAEAKREEDEIRRKLQAEEAEYSRREEARLQDFLREQEEKRLQNESQQPDDILFDPDPQKLDPKLMEEQLEVLRQAKFRKWAEDIQRTREEHERSDSVGNDSAQSGSSRYLSVSPGTSPDMLRTQFNNGPSIRERSPGSSTGGWGGGKQQEFAESWQEQFRHAQEKLEAERQRKSGGRPISRGELPTRGSGNTTAFLSEAQMARKQQELAESQREQYRRVQERLEAQRHLQSTGISLSPEELQEVFENHEKLWARLKTLKELSWDDFPWPMAKQPSNPDDISLFLIEAYIQSPLYPDKSRTPKDRIKDCIKRWHPDTFEAKLRKVVENEREKVKYGAGNVARCLSDLLEKEKEEESK